MDQHPVPRQITTFEFKLIGFMTLRQFLYLLVAFPVAYIVFALFPIPIVNILLAVVVAVIGILFAFVPIQDRPIEVWVRNLWKRLQSPTQYFYHKQNEPLYFLKDLYFLADPHHMLAHIESKEKLAKYLTMTRQRKRPDRRKQQVTQALHKSTSDLRTDTRPYQGADASTVSETQAAPQAQGPMTGMAAGVASGAAAAPAASGPVSWAMAGPSNPSPATPAQPQASGPQPEASPQPEETLKEPLKPEVLPQQPTGTPPPPTPAVTPPVPTSPLTNAPTADQPAAVPAPPVPTVTPPAPTPVVEQPTVTAPVQQPTVTQPSPQPQPPPPPQEHQPPPPPAPTAAQQPKATVTQQQKPFLTGIVKTAKRYPLPGVMVYIKDGQGNPIRMMKTNPHGVFATFNPMQPGTYLLEVKDPNGTYFFDTMNISVKETNTLPIEVISKEIL